MPVALITGASRGIGAASARRFAAEGYDLLLVARSLADLDGLATELRALGRRVETLALDLSQAGAIGPALAELLGRGLVPSVVINNAGAAWTGPLADMPIERWQWLLQLNLTSVFQVCLAVLPALRRAGGGRIINVSSHAARNAFPEWGAYCVSKAALASFSRCLEAEERSAGIAVSTLTLGAVNTPLWDSETVHSSFDRRAMLSAEQVAESLLYLARQPHSQTVEDLTLMPAAGAF
ncbi:short chain dehydrogenase [Cyanobium sp. Copco_Reservoir_LC18]|uniref:SDR family oxidoreductase n=1 Tax=Cyanobium sp. Copco_Reservoir_LC18 TaxID=1328305 RepID=UPI00135A74FE|nr:SDR family oxidoreductase [Cyanobium sp. Copco_Reservoir_LC18]KAF0652559.1 short chain dehydrogenase [Cyanobium sp. Copco_Reservoir_LC18]